MILSDNTLIPASQIRVINYDKEDDEGKWRNSWTNLFGRVIQAQNKINNHKKFWLEISTQNYWLYYRIKAQMKMQKKCCGIWWNIKTDDMELGWYGVGLESTFNMDVTKIFRDNLYNTPYIGNTMELPRFLRHKFPFRNNGITLINVPFTNHDFTTENVNSFVRKKISQILPKIITGIVTDRWTYDENQLTQHFMQQYDYHDYGLYTTDKNRIKCIIGQDYDRAKRRKTMSKTFYDEKHPIFNEITVGISYNIDNNRWSGFSFKPSGKPKTQIGFCHIYGAVKYKGTWHGARIYKEVE